MEATEELSRTFVGWPEEDVRQKADDEPDSTGRELALD